MPFPLALLPWLPAIATGTGAVIKTGQRYGPQIAQGGINLLNKAGQSPWLTNLANRFTHGFAPQSGKISNTFSQLSFPGGMMSSNPMNIYGLDNIKSGIEFPQEVAEDLGIDDKDFWREQFDKLLFKDEKEDKKEKKKEDKKEKKKENKKEKNEEPSIDDLPLDAEEAKNKKNLKKGGYVKKQRKRKHYKTSGFVKMKKSKKRKYIKE